MTSCRLTIRPLRRVLMILLLSGLIVVSLIFFSLLRMKFLRNKTVPYEAYETLVNLVQTLVQNVELSLQAEREARREHEARILGMLQANLMATPPLGLSYTNAPRNPSLEEEFALAQTNEERERILNERLGEIDFERPIDDI